MSENSQERDVFDAIADPTRRRLIRLLAEAEEIPLHELTVQFPMGRTAVSKHLTILKEAGLVLDRKVGRETRFRLNADPLREVHDWLTFYSNTGAITSSDDSNAAGQSDRLRLHDNGKRSVP